MTMKTIDEVLAAMQASLDRMTVPAPPVDSIDAILAALQRQVAGSAVPDLAGPLLGGKVLVRKLNSVRDAWTFLCPHVDCQVWMTGFQTVEACRVGWYKHADVKHPEGSGAVWPADVEVGEATQPVCWPGHFKDEDILIDMIRTRDAVDREGRPLNFGDCPVCPGRGRTRHKLISGRTCVQQVTCPKCQARPGHECDRSTKALSPVRFGTKNQASAHKERFPVAAAADDARRAAGDMTLPAAWRPEPAPTARKRKPSVGMPVTLVVDADAQHNDMWQSMVREYNSIGRLRWTNGGKRAHLAFPDMQTATWSAGFIAQFYGISSDRIRVDAEPQDWPTRTSDYAWRVRHDAEQVLQNTTAATPDAHVAWAAGVLCTDQSQDLMPTKLTLDSFVNIAHGSTLGYGSGMTWECDRTAWRLHQMGQPWRLVKKLRWGQVIKAIQGRISPVLRVEMAAAEAEVGSFPHSTVEWSRAMSWSLDVAMQAWMEVRPAGLAPFVAVTEAEAEAVLA